MLLPVASPSVLITVVVVAGAAAGPVIVSGIVDIIIAAVITMTVVTLLVLWQVRWLRDHEVSDTLLRELMEESTQVWAFIMEREIESPERFQAIQSYRATMAVLRQQVHYIEQLRDSGMIDEAEEGMLLR